MKAYLVFEPVLGEDKDIQFFRDNFARHTWITNAHDSLNFHREFYRTAEVNVKFSPARIAEALTNLFPGITFHGYAFVNNYGYHVPYEIVFNDIGCNEVFDNASKSWLRKVFDDNIRWSEAHIQRGAAINPPGDDDKVDKVESTNCCPPESGAVTSEEEINEEEVMSNE